MTFIFAEPKEWWLDVPPPTRAQSWEQSQRHVTPRSRWNAYINQICIKTVLERIKVDNVPEATAWLSTTQMPAIWDIVNGSAIIVDTTKLVLIPTEVIDDDGLEVPQEWVDIPSWVGDYYIVVQVKPEAEWLRVWGYTTHHEIKTKGDYDASDRTYCIDALDLNQDMNSLWVRRRFYSEQTRAVVPQLPKLPTSQAENLIQRLGNPELVFPHLSAPFTIWGALIEDENWRQRLYATRGGNNVFQLTQLSEWFDGAFGAMWQTLEDVLSGQQIATAWRGQNTRNPNNLISQNQNSVFDVNRVKVLDFGSQPSSQQVALLVGVSTSKNAEVEIGIKVCPIGDASYLPNEVRVRLLDENGAEVGQASAGATQTIQFRFGGQPGERFSIEVACGNKTITENFVI